MKILLTGCNGQVGWELQRALAPLGEVLAVDRRGSDELCGDLTQQDGLVQTVRTVRPDVIVNAAAYTAVDRAESEPDLARLVNAEAPAVLAREAKASGAWLVHYSTDYVFDGSGDRRWQESDRTGPINVYGETKLAGEDAIRESGCNHLIFRTSWVYAPRGANFIRTMLRLAAERDALKVINDQMGAPTGAELIADVTAHAVRTVHSGDNELSGLYHLAAAGETSWHGYASFVIEYARRAGWSTRLADEAIEAVPTEAFPTAAKRPHYSRLDCSRLENTFGLQMPDWQRGVERAVDEMVMRDEG